MLSALTPPQTMAWRRIYPGPAGPAVPLGADRLLLGEDATGQVVLHPDAVARPWAELTRSGPAFVLRDLPAGAEITVNGRRPSAGSMLAAGDIVRAGHYIGAITLADGHEGVPLDPSLPPGFYAGPVLQRVLRSARLGARSDLPMVLVGETGTGKERVARLIHRWSGRRGEFVAINCAAIPENLAESELFGHRQGAFTGASRARAGLLRAAEGGTVLLDEVTDLPLAVQAKLLRVMQEREVQPLGESRTVPLDVRFVAASQVPLSRAVQLGRMRLDFRARLEGLVVTLPPLRQRAEEIPYLFESFLQQHGPGQAFLVDPKLIELLCLHSWPLNVRELELLVRRLLVLHGDEPRLRAEHLADQLLPDSAGPASLRGKRGYRPQELSGLLAALEASSGNLTQACTRLGISRSRAYRLLKAAGTDRAGR